MADGSQVSQNTGYECELTAGRVEGAEGLNGAVDGSLTGAIRLGSGADGSASLARFEALRDGSKEWRWRLSRRNGDIIAISGEGYPRQLIAEKGLSSVIENAAEAEITETPTN